MNIIINSTTKNTEVTDAIKAKIEEKLSKISKFVAEYTDVRVVIRVVKTDQIVEITIPNHYGKTVRVEERAASLYSAIDTAERSLTRKLRKLKEKNIDKKRKTACDNNYEKEVDLNDDDENIDIKIEREKKVDLVKLLDRDAIEQMILLGHNFFIYKDMNGDVCVVYRRSEGGCGIIRTKE